MKMSDNDRLKILEAGKFLEEKGFEVKTDEYSVRYYNGDVIISAFYERYEKYGDMDIKFIDGNYHFIIGWIWVVRNGNRYIKEEGLDKLLMLMKFTKDNFDKITNLEWCQESRVLINEFFEHKKADSKV